ncbi:hypothetical protein JCM10207_002359 [Rhodosporidiobolus poonsookiae]
MLDQSSGFSAGLALVRPLHDDTFLDERCSASFNPREQLTYVEAPSGAPRLRVFFRREAQVRPVTGLEAYAAVLVVGEQSFAKVYAVGLGVSNPPSGPVPWFLDANSQDFEHDPAAAAQQRIVLAIYPCKVRPGVPLGQVLTLPLPSASLTARPDPPRLPTLDNAPTRALSFLRHANRVLIALLTPEQRVAFVERLGLTSEVLALLPLDCRDELVSFARPLPRALTPRPGSSAAAGQSVQLPPIRVFEPEVQPEWGAERAWTPSGSRRGREGSPRLGEYESAGLDVYGGEYGVMQSQ